MMQDGCKYSTTTIKLYALKCSYFFIKILLISYNSYI